VTEERPVHDSVTTEKAFKVPAVETAGEWRGNEKQRHYPYIVGLLTVKQ